MLIATLLQNVQDTLFFFNLQCCYNAKTISTPSFCTLKIGYIVHLMATEQKEFNIGLPEDGVTNTVTRRREMVINICT